MKTTQSEIFLSDQRSTIESERIKRHSSFNFERFQHPSKSPIGPLYALHDDRLAAKASINFYTRECGYILLIPITGAVQYSDEQNNGATIEVGKSLMIFLAKDAFFCLQNLHQDMPANYLFIAFKAEQQKEHLFEILKINLSAPNQINTINPNLQSFKVGVGRFLACGENRHGLNGNAILYCFVLAGTFEIEGKLLHDRDSIALSAINSVEMKALSENAIVLTIELPKDTGYILF